MSIFSLLGIQKQPPHESIRRNHAYFASFDQGRDISDYDFVVFDTELTGLDRKEDEIIAIGAVRIKNLRIITGETFHTYIRPTSLEPRDSTLVHRITPQQLQPAPTMDTILRSFVNFCGSSLLVGHYVDLDIAFINRETRRILHGTLKNPCLDTMRMAHIYTTMCWEQYYDRYNLQVSYNLADLAKTYGLPEFGRHDALQDAMQTAYLFLFLAKRMRIHGIHSLKDLYAAGKSWKYIF